MRLTSVVLPAPVGPTSATVWPGSATSDTSWIWFLAEGFCYGRIAPASSGRYGFGYDPLFIPRGYDETLAVLGPEVKSRLSHRSVAAGALGRMLPGCCVVK